MFKSASKFLFGLAGLAFLSAIVLGVATSDQGPIDSILGPITMGYKGGVGDHVGYSILISLAVVSFFLGVFLASLRDADPEAEAQLVGLETVPEAPEPTTVNYWPVIGAFSAAAVVLGLAIGSEMVVVGAVGLVCCTVEWAARAWADRATGDAEVNQTIRNRLMNPIEIPVLAVLGIGGLVLAVSRILLALPKTGSYLAFAIIPTVMFIFGVLILMKPKMSQSAIAAILLVGGLAILAGGVAAAIAGEREHGGGHEEEHGGEEGLAPLPGPAELVITVSN